MQSNPVLLWSFDDTLYPKLVLESPREVTFLSFCPYDGNLLIGGLITGQLIIWDLKNCLHRIENPDELTDKQEKNREKLYSFMKWSKFVENLQKNVVRPAAISHYELSHKKISDHHQVVEPQTEWFKAHERRIYQGVSELQTRPN